MLKLVKQLEKAIKDIKFEISCGCADARMELRTAPKDSVAFGHADGRAEAYEKMYKMISSLDESGEGEPA